MLSFYKFKGADIYLNPESVPYKPPLRVLHLFLHFLLKRQGVKLLRRGLQLKMLEWYLLGS
jgi:hypothetical protein